MALRIKDRVKQGTTTTGSGTINLDVSFSSSGFQDFSVLGNGTETYYAIEEGSNFEIGLGTYNSNTLTRSTILDSSNGGAKIALNGNANVFVTYPADKAVFTDADNNATVTGLIVGQTGVKFNDGTIQTTAATSTSYTAGTGLALVGTEFSTSGTGTFTQINFDLGVTPSHNEGTIFYDNDNKALAVYNDEADITLQVGQEEYVRVRNNTTGTISNGQVVYINGSQGGTGPTVELAIATGEATSQVIGLATHDIAQNSFGYVTSFGVVRDVDTSKFNDGDSVYVSEAVAGGLTGVAPVIPNYKAPVGHVIRSHPSNGTILVQIVAPKLGGGDAKVVNGNINLSGIPFYTVVANTNAGGMSSDAAFVYDSGNERLHVGSGGIRFDDASVQTTAFTGTDFSGYATEAYVTGVSGDLQTQITTNANNIASTGATNAAAISTNSTDIATVSGLTVTNANNISSNDTDISNLSGLVATNTSDISTVSGLTVTNSNDIDTVSGLTVTNATNISNNSTDISTVSGLTVTNSNDINTVSGLLYNSWTVTDGSNSEAISGGDEVKFTGTGATTVSYNTGNNTFTINTPSSETSYDYWTATDGNNTSNIANGNTVKITGSNDTTVSFASGDPNLFTVQSTQEVLLTGINAGQPTGFSMVKSVPLSVSGGDAISVSLTSVNPATFLVSHDDTSSQSTLSTTPNFFITSITLDDYGHVTSLGSGEVTGVGSGGGGGGDFSFNVCSDTIGSGDTLTIQGGSGIQVDCGSTTTISATGVLMSGDASLYEYWTLQGDGTDCNDSTFTIQNATAVQVQGSGGTTVCMAGGSDPVITISSEANLYDGWIAKGFNVSGDAIQKTIEDDDSVTITGAGSTTVIAETGATSITYTISGDNSSFYGNWKAGDGDGTFATIQSTNEVEWSGAGLTSVDRTDKLFTISGSPTIYLGGSGITVTGNSSPYTIHGDLATTTSVGITQLDHDISGASQTGAATPYGVKEYVNDYIGSSGYGYWVASDGSTSSNIDKNETLEFVGQGIITATVTSGDPTTTVSISGAQYIPGSGLTQDPLKTFNVNTDNSTLEVVSDTVRVKDSGITNIKLAGGITNDKLVNNSFTVTAASGLTGGGEAELGSGVTLGIGDGAITTGMLESSSITINGDNGITGGGEIFLGGTGVLSGVDATTSVKGVVQLQDSAEDGVVDKAITPNAVYDISGALQTNIDGKDNYTKWVLQGDGATTTDIDSAETVQFTGAGNVSISLGGTDNRTVTISGNDVSNTYVAGSGLNEDPSKTFNVQTDNSTLEVNSDIVRIKDGGVTNDKLAGSIANTKLTNDSVTVTAGSGLSNGGEVDLGATITLDITPGGVTNDMLGGSIANDKLSNSSVSYGGVSVSLGASDATPAFNLTDATGYPTSSLVGTITNAQLAGSIDNSKLSNSSVTITAGTGLSNGGAVSLGSSVTIDADTASTSQVGVVQLQDSATDGTTDKAITPNAVYDISGVLQSGIDGAGGASDLNDLGDVSYGGTNLSYTILINNNPGSAPNHGTLGSDNARNLGIGYLALSSITDASDNIVLGGFAGWHLTQGDKNVFLGPNAGEQITDGDNNISIGYATQRYGNGGDYNIAIGAEALRGNTDGTTTTNNLNNIGIGQQALYQIEGGDSNVAIGYKSANEIKDGEQNVAIGYQAQQYDESCDHNVAVGRDALRGSASSNNQQYNVGVGALALYTITTGGKNTSVGGNSGPSLTTGSSNIFLGYSAGNGATATESDMLYIGNNHVLLDGTIIKADMSEKHVAIGMADDHFSNSAGSATLQVYPKDNADPAILVKAVASPTTDAKALKVDDSTGTEVYSITAKGAIKSNIKSNTYGSTVTFDLDESNTHTVTLTGSPTLALSNVTAGQKFMVKLIQDGTGSHTVTWWSTIKWAGGTEPTLTTDPNKADTFGFLCTSSGNYDGFIVGQNI